MRESQLRRDSCLVTMVLWASIAGGGSVVSVGCDDTRARWYVSSAPSDQAATPSTPRSAVDSARAAAPGRAPLERAVPPPAELSPRTPVPRSGASPPLFERLGYARPPAQTLACGQLGFVRLTDAGFEVYSYQRQTRTARHEHGAFTHVIAQPGYSYLLVGGGASLLYYQANPNHSSLGHLPALGAFTIWPDPQHRERVWVHYAKDDAIVHFALPRDTARPPEALGTVPLAHFDGSLLTRLTAGQWLFGARSEAETASQLGLVDGSRAAWLGGFPADTEALLPGAGARVWLLSRRQVRTFEGTVTERLEPRGAVDLAGEPWVAASDGPRLAVLTQRLGDGQRQWRVQVVSTAKTSPPVELGLSDAGSIASAARRGICLVPDRAWVIVGGPTELFVINYATGEVLLQR